jgi:hypothetical protein
LVCRMASVTSSVYKKQNGYTTIKSSRVLLLSTQLEFGRAHPVSPECG